jgi:hypothetical protein
LQFHPVCDTIIPEGDGKTPTKRKEVSTMGIEFFEMMDTALTEVNEWLDFEADLEEAYPW